MSSSRGKQRHHEDEHEEHVNHEAWVIPYADVLTLLMALFLVLFALGRTDEEKLKVAADSFRRELGRGESVFDLGIGSGGAGPLASGGASVLDGAGPAPLAGDLPPDAQAPPTTVDSAIAPPEVVLMPSLVDAADVVPAALDPIEQDPIELGDPLSEVERTVREAAAGSGLLNAIGFRREARGLVVTIVTDQVLFEDGQAEVQRQGRVILDVVADALRDLPNTVVVEGHTDSRPIATARYPSNWELSTARATSVLRYLVEARGLAGERVGAAGYADTRPIATGTDQLSFARNRRVEIVVLATA